MEALRQPVQLADGLYLVYTEFPHRRSGNVYLITGRVNTLVDWGSEDSFPLVKANLRKIGLRLSDIKQGVSTHGDFDHTQGFRQFAAKVSKAPMLIHQADWLPMINGDPILTKAYVYGQPFKPLPAERCIPLAGNQLLTMGDSEWLFIHTPGHSKGSSCLLGAIGDQRWLIAGDTVGGSLIDPDLIGPEASAEYLAEWRASLTMLSQLEFDWVLTGHDHRPLSRAEFDHRVRYFGRMTNPWFDLDEDDEEAAASVAYLSTLLTLGHHTHAAD